MIKIENNSQYEWAISRVEELLSLVNDNTLENDPNYIELILLSNLVADYSEEHFRFKRTKYLYSDLFRRLK